jgi:hypothetical protein
VKEVAPLLISASNRLRMGNWVGSVGHGEGAFWSFNTGIVSNIDHIGKGRPTLRKGCYAPNQNQHRLVQGKVVLLVQG